jgi:hypothetical protein
VTETRGPSHDVLHIRAAPSTPTHGRAPPLSVPKEVEPMWWRSRLLTELPLFLSIVALFALAAIL